MPKTLKEILVGTPKGRALAKEQRKNDLKLIKKALVGTPAGQALARRQKANDIRFLKSLVSGKKFKPEKKKTTRKIK